MRPRCISDPQFIGVLVSLSDESPSQEEALEYKNNSAPQFIGVLVSLSDESPSQEEALEGQKARSSRILYHSRIKTHRFYFFPVFPFFFHLRRRHRYRPLGAHKVPFFAKFRIFHISSLLYETDISHETQRDRREVRILCFVEQTRCD